MRVLGLIPARGGSKGLPRKNIRLLGDKPLLQYTAEAALAAKRLGRLILTTDDEEIAEVGRACGLDVPFMRPPELAEDDTPMLSVVQHAVRWLEERQDRYDAICLLQPTSPFRPPYLIDHCIERLETSRADAVISVLPVPPKYNPHWVFLRENDAGTLRLSTGEIIPIATRQSLPPAFHREGSVYVVRRDVVIEQGSLYGQRLEGVEVDPQWSVNIDTNLDWVEAQSLLARSAHEKVHH